MSDREKVIKGLEHCSEDGCKGCPYGHDCDVYCDIFYGFGELAKDALELLKEQQEERNRMVSWLAKFCVHIDNFPDGIKNSYAEQYDFYKRKMNQQFGWEVD